MELPTPQWTDISKHVSSEFIRTLVAENTEEEAVCSFWRGGGPYQEKQQRRRDTEAGSQRVCGISPGEQEGRCSAGARLSKGMEACMHMLCLLCPELLVQVSDVTPDAGSPGSAASGLGRPILAAGLG